MDTVNAEKYSGTVRQGRLRVSFIEGSVFWDIRRNLGHVVCVSLHVSVSLSLIAEVRSKKDETPHTTPPHKHQNSYTFNTRFYHITT